MKIISRKSPYYFSKVFVLASLAVLLSVGPVNATGTADDGDNALITFSASTKISGVNPSDINTNTYFNTPEFLQFRVSTSVGIVNPDDVNNSSSEDDMDAVVKQAFETVWSELSNARITFVGEFSTSSAPSYTNNSNLYKWEMSGSEKTYVELLDAGVLSGTYYIDEYWGEINQLSSGSDLYNSIYFETARFSVTVNGVELQISIQSPRLNFSSNIRSQSLASVIGLAADIDGMVSINVEHMGMEASVTQSYNGTDHDATAEYYGVLSSDAEDAFEAVWSQLSNARIRFVGEFSTSSAPNYTNNSNLYKWEMSGPEKTYVELLDAGVLSGTYYIDEYLGEINQLSSGSDLYNSIYFETARFSVTVNGVELQISIQSPRLNFSSNIRSQSLASVIGLEPDVDGMVSIDIELIGMQATVTQSFNGMGSDETAEILHDADGDGVADGADTFPNDSSEVIDTDGDGVGNNADSDDDGDGVEDFFDALPLDSAETTDTDGDGVGNNADNDDDGDGFSDTSENDAGTDPLDNTNCIDCQPINVQISLSNSVVPFLEADVELFSLNSSDQASKLETLQQGEQGNYEFSEKFVGRNLITVSRAYDGALDSHYVNTHDALFAIKIAVGLNPNEDPDGDGPLLAPEVSAEQILAADINGDGSVTSYDALSILKASVNLASVDALPRWVFSANSDQDVESTSLSEAEINWPMTRTVNFKAVLLGDVDGNWLDPNVTDSDLDGVVDALDRFPFDASETVDADNDGIGNNADLDDDNDGVADELDAFPLNPTESEDYDEDGIGNNSDLDNDNDGVEDLSDAFPFDGTETLDTDGDQIGNNEDTDDDGDGVADVDDFFPLDATRSESDGDLVVFKDGVVGPIWDAGIRAFDSAIDWTSCVQDGGAGCPSIGWEVVTDAERGDVLQVSHSVEGHMAGLYFRASQPVDLSDYSAGAIEFDIKVVSGDSKITMKLDCVYPCTSGDKALGSKGSSGWEAVSISLSSLSATGLVLSSVDTGLVIWATDAAGTVFLLDNVRFTGIADDAEPPTEVSGPALPPSSSSYEILSYGAGSISNSFNPESYRCVVDYGNWIYNAGVVEPAIAACDAQSRIPTGTPTPLSPQLTGEALNKPVPTHKWWGSVGFVGEMTVGDNSQAAYITPDPVRARISNMGARINGIPSGFRTYGNYPRYEGPVPFDEVFEGVAIANSAHSNMDAYVKDHSDGSVTVQWKSGATAVMDATFVHGSPYVYFKVHQGKALVRTLRNDGGEKGTFYNQGNHLGIWTNVAGIRNSILLTGEGLTTYSDVSSNEITINNDSKEFTLTYLPEINGVASDSMSSFFASKARNKVASVEIDYSVDRSTNKVTVNHAYKDAQGNPVDTIVGLHPLHWKNSSQATSQYKIRSARGMIKFSEAQGFSYELPFTGVLPTMPSIENSFDQDTLESLVKTFVNAGESVWINSTDTYWSGKAFGKVAETAALAQSIGMDAEAGVLIDWLKVELADWFTAETDGNLDINKYFVYDENWDALFGVEESYGSHQRMADHHFHYGYFVRAAAEICRVDVAWCGDDQFGPMIELLIRDYAGDESEEMFPRFRNFDPANGFSWADGKGDSIQGNNNESTSEAANAYGAMVLYGLAVGKDDIVEKGMYMHASTAAAFWQYWNNIDGYNNLGSDYDNFPAGYNKITTSIVWGSGADFSTWFSPAYAHILGIQGLPSNPLILYVGQYADYMQSYFQVGMTESTNGKPSGLKANEWTDLWWNLWAMTDADAALADYNSVGTNYGAEAGESKAHTYHWLHTFNALGHLKTGTGDLTADYPGALAFDDENGERTYVVYNFSAQPITVTYSDGRHVTASAKGFTLEHSSSYDNGQDLKLAIDAEKWFHQTKLPNGSSWYNNEQQHYTNRLDNSYVSDGTLKIVAKKEEFTDQGVGKQYTSARLNSKYAFKYGRVEVRAKMPVGVGTWPAIWMLGKNIDEPGGYWTTEGFGDTPWPQAGELDIMEHWGSNQNMVSSAIHSPSSYGGTINKGEQYLATASTKFHTYSLEWSSEEMIFAVDGFEHYRYNPAVKDANTWPFDSEMYLLLNVAIEPSITSGFDESAMEVDFVRVYDISSGQPMWSDEFAGGVLSSSP